MAKEIGVSHTSVQRIWAEAGLKPHLTRKFKLSNDPKFAEKVTDVVGLYMNPPERTFIVSDKRSLWHWCCASREEPDPGA